MVAPTHLFLSARLAPCFILVIPWPLHEVTRRQRDIHSLLCPGQTSTQALVISFMGLLFLEVPLARLQALREQAFESPTPSTGLGMDQAFGESALKQCVSGCCRLGERWGWGHESGHPRLCRAGKRSPRLV